jgi:2-dehydropantoate 2-reductase
MNQKTRIAILGIGGVGGYLGGLLAEKYSNSENIEIILISKQATTEIIRQNGLKLVIDGEERITHPLNVTSDPAEIGSIDYLLCSIKGYDLEESLAPLKKSIGPNSIILPLLNGVDATEKISKIFPYAHVAYGCVYMVSSIIEPAVIRVSGNHSIYMGSVKGSNDKLIKLENILRDAGINARQSEDIIMTCWEKFIFISPLASLTTYLDKSIAEVLKDEDQVKLLHQLLSEIKAIADAKNIRFPGDILNETFTKMEKMPVDALTSMHRDFRNGRKTELSSLTEYVVKLGRQFDVPTPTYARVLTGIYGKMLTKK